MNKWIKRGLVGCLGLFLMLFIVLSLFIYKARYGFNFYDTKAPEISQTMADTAILVFSKTNGFSHTEAIKASLPAYEKLAAKNGWSVYSTTNGAVFNEEQLALFDVIIWNNSTGEVANEAQQKAIINFVESGGGWLGIHGAGDNSHSWPWYVEDLLAAEFTHHTMNPGVQEAALKNEASNHPIMKGIPTDWIRTDEWYAFRESPRKNGVHVLLTVDETTYNPDGEFLFFNKGLAGMGPDHPIAWYKCLKKGRAVFNAMGHTASSFSEPLHMQFIESAIRWAAGAGASGCE